MVAEMAIALRKGRAPLGTEVVVCPPFPLLGFAVDALVGSPIAVGAQNVHPAREGAFTGEVSAMMLKEAGVAYGIVGHSERRQIFGESDAFVGEKLKALLAAGIKPILCVGETLEERESGAQEEVVRRQLHGALEIAAQELEGGEAIKTMAVAYEPVWAIGTGQTASPEQANGMHAFLRELLKDRDPGAAPGIPLLYGGSVNPSNAAELLGQSEIDGVLVGGASLKAESFLAIIHHAAS